MNMPTDRGGLVQHLQRVQALQRAEAQDAAFARRLHELRTWQAARLARTYADLSENPHKAPAVEFFLTDLYGPQQFSQRDRELARAAPVLERTLPRGALHILLDALELYALSAELDQTLVRALDPGEISNDTYARAYRAAGHPQERQRQIELIVDIGEALAHAVGQPLIGLALRATHVPAHVTGFGALQDFLERGFDAFRKLDDAQTFIDVIRTRESALSDALLHAQANPLGP